MLLIAIKLIVMDATPASVIVISAVQLFNAPVCGTDGITYDNKCKMNRQSCVKESSITVQYEGKCGSAARDECNKHCSKDYRPVCGTNGKSYNNECHIRGSACTDGINVTVAYRGECNGGEKTLRFSVLSLLFAFSAFLIF